MKVMSAVAISSAKILVARGQEHKKTRRALLDAKKNDEYQKCIMDHKKGENMTKQGVQAYVLKTLDVNPQLFGFSAQFFRQNDATGG